MNDTKHSWRENYNKPYSSEEFANVKKVIDEHIQSLLKNGKKDDLPIHGYILGSRIIATLCPKN